MKRALFALAWLILPAAALAQPVYGTPHLQTDQGPQTASLDGLTIVNKGLIGAGRLSASARDFAGETIGSFSGLALNAATWRRAGGAWRGNLYSLPDRGPNNIGGVPGTSNYRARVLAHQLTLRPYAGPALPALPTSQSQIVLRPTGGVILKDAVGAPFTGKDPGPHQIQRDGAAYPSPADGPGAGRISLDPEAMTRLADGSFYVSDEYAAGIYRFDKDGRQTGVITPPEALLPRRGGQVNFSGEGAPETGRRNNQGLEGLSVTPDGKTLVTILQSGPMQDVGKGAAGRFNTRVLVYDLTASATPRAPVGHYVLQLPRVSEAGAGGPPDATAAVSELIALDASHFLVLARDSIGRGGGPNAAGTPIFKSILLISTEGATNLAGTPYETSAKPVAPNAVLDPAVTPMKMTEAVNLLNPTALARFGLNLRTINPDMTTLSEKWEGMALAPALDPSAPNDWVLIVSNDNDFVTAKGRVDGHDFDASLKGDRGSGDIDNLLLAYRLTIARAPR